MARELLDHVRQVTHALDFASSHEFLLQDALDYVEHRSLVMALRNSYAQTREQCYRVALARCEGEYPIHEDILVRNIVDMQKGKTLEDKIVSASTNFRSGSYAKEAMKVLLDYEPVAQQLLHWIRPQLEDPLKCARLLSSNSFRETFSAYYLQQAQFLLAEAHSSPRSRRSASSRNAVQRLSDSCENFRMEWGTFSEFIEWLNIAERHPLYATNYSPIFPLATRDNAFDPIEQIILESTRDPTIIYRLTARDFERFVARIWEAFGFEVNLTAKTHDGGVDIICVTSKLGVPLKIAIQVKRYRDQPVSVELVRAFVGANAMIKANKLVFVTSSSYSRDALAFASAQSLTNLLELRALPDVVRWAQEFERLSVDATRTSLHTKGR